MSSESILGRIRKLLALADHESGGTEAERTLAAERAQELMFKHQLDLAQINAHVSQDDIDRHVEVIQGTVNQWRANFLGLIGEACGCTAFITRSARNYSTCSLVGRRENAELSLAIYRSLADWLQAEASLGYRRALQEGRYVKPNSYRRAFYAAASSRISLRLTAKRNRMSRDAGSTGMELVHNDKAANQKWLEDHGVRMRKARARSYRDGGGMRAGRDAGDRASLDVRKNVNRQTRGELNA